MIETKAWVKKYVSDQNEDSVQLINQRTRIIYVKAPRIKKVPFDRITDFLEAFLSRADLNCDIVDDVLAANAAGCGIAISVGGHH